MKNEFLILCLVGFVTIIWSLRDMSNAIIEVAKAIREQTKYFEEDDDYDDGDEWKRLINNN